MAELKTKKTDESVDDFLDAIKDADLQADARRVVELLAKATDSRPKLWGSGIIGFGDLRYGYPNGKVIDWFVIGFAPRSKKLTLYLMAGFEKLHPLLKKLGRHTTAKSCLYIPSLADVDEPTLTKIIEQGVKEARALDRARGESKEKHPGADA